MFSNNKKIQIRKWKFYLWLAVVFILLSVLAASCTKESIYIEESRVTGDNEVLVSLLLNIPISDRIQTKATPKKENQISSFYVIVFDVDNKLSQVATSSTDHTIRVCKTVSA